ncbi:MAG: hypothetical protein O7G85_13635 [Planctomycetota bacterium]|nr:hypothetical protein [Planctomycetota bacterium]
MKPLDPGQYRLWHRLRRMPRFVFVIGFGAILTSGLIVSLNAFMTWAVAGVSIGAMNLLLVYFMLMLAVGASFAWTWSYMQKRYAATIDLRCPQCGYLTMGLHSSRCPECGNVLGSP